MREGIPYFALLARPGGAVKAAAVTIVFGLGLWASAAMADNIIGAACPGGAGNAQSANGNNTVCIGGVWQYPAYQFGSTAATCNSTNAGIIKYTGNHAYFCNGAAWTQPYEVQSTPVVTAPTGSGYFVMSYGTWNGNLAGLAGADAKCLSDLTTYTGWMGWSDANSRGLLVASKVHSPLCTGATCTNLTASTTYYFSSGANVKAGGGSFTTDAGGALPGDGNSWASANYFGGTYTFWSGRNSTSATQWSTTSSFYNCNSWTSTSAAYYSIGGITSSTDGKRWHAFQKGSICDQYYHLICAVNP
jgi:hypothetical protein